jgi:hypothetical protein
MVGATTIENQIRELLEARLGSRLAATGFTRHTSNGVLLPTPYWLRIVQLVESGGYYLLYLTETLEEQTDTLHETIEDAMKTGHTRIRHHETRLDNDQINIVE